MKRQTNNMSTQNKYIGDPIETSDFWYDLTDGGYIKPEKIMSDKKRGEELAAALKLLLDWRNEMVADDHVVYF